MSNNRKWYRDREDLEICSLCQEKMDVRVQTLRYHTPYGEVVHEACFQTALDQETDRC